MTRPRFTIGGMVMLAVVCAVEFGILRALIPVDGRPEKMPFVLIAVGSPPMVGLLAMGLPRLVRQARGRAPRRPFLVGFQVAGWTTAGAYVAWCLVSHESLIDFVEWAAGPAFALLRSILDGSHILEGLDDRVAELIEIAVVMPFLVLPQWLVALAGGWAAKFWKSGRGDPEDNGQQPRRRLLRRPRFTISGLMTLAAFVAVNGAVTRFLILSNDDTAAKMLATGLWGMGNVLALGLATIAGRARRRQSVGSFLVGFEVAGGSASLIYAACCLASAGLGRVYIDWAVTPYFKLVMRVLDAYHVSPSSIPSAVGVAVDVSGIIPITLPFLLVALAGGWLARWWASARSPSPLPAPGAVG